MGLFGKTVPKTVGMEPNCKSNATSVDRDFSVCLSSMGLVSPFYETVIVQCFRFSISYSAAVKCN